MVHIVGAGSGAKDLITIRGAKLLSSADVIIYAGSLINKELLDYAKSDAEVYNSADLTLDEIMNIIYTSNAESKEIVRLHTGDPSIYGAIREQMDLLKSKNIDFDICPGVSSLQGAAAALNAEYTLPNVSQTVIVTRMEGRTKVPKREQIEKLATHQATMVIFLSAGLTEKVTTALLSGGYPYETPAAIVYKATWPDQKILRCTVGTLHETAVQNGINNLALITVGNFLGDNYELSKLYDANFTTGLRKAKTD